MYKAEDFSNFYSVDNFGESALVTVILGLLNPDELGVSALL